MELLKKDKCGSQKLPGSWEADKTNPPCFIFVRQNAFIPFALHTRCQYSTIQVTGDTAANKECDWKIIRSTHIPYCCLKNIN